MNMASFGVNIEDAASLLEYLRAKKIVTKQETPGIRKLEGGVSNRVVLVTPAHGKPMVLKQALEKLRVEVDWFCTPERIKKEAAALRYLSEFVPAGSVPALLFEDTAEYLLAMEEVPEPHQNWKQLLLSGTLLPDHVEQFGRLLGNIHGGSTGRREEAAEIFADRSVFETLRLEPYYRYTGEQVPEAGPFLEKLIADTLAQRLCLVHGDYSPKNILIHAGKLVLLDCEVVHLGDPGFDIGFSMAHFLGKANHLASRRADFAEAANRYWEVYAEEIAPQAWAEELEPRAVRHALGCSLARVAGRSPLEYLSPDERLRQRKVVLNIMREPPRSMTVVVAQFTEGLTCR